MDLRSVFIEIVKINRDRDGIFENQAYLEVPDETNASKINVHLSPKYGPFTGGVVTFEFNLPSDFPQHPPTCSCKTKIFHPNVSFSGGVCFNLFSSEWQPGMTLSTCVVPAEEYQDHVQRALRGLSVKGVDFPESVNPDVTARPFLKLEGTEYFKLVCGDLTEWTKLDPLFDGKYSDMCPTDSPLMKQLSHFRGGEMKKSVSRHSRRRTVQSIKHRCDLLGVAEDACILKEVVFLVRDRPLLVLTGGYDRIDQADLAHVLGVPTEDVIFPSISDLKDRKINVGNLSVLQLPENTDILLNEHILAQEEVYVHVGDQVFLRTAPGLIYKALGPENYLSAELTTARPEAATGCLTGIEKRAAFYFDSATCQGILLEQEVN